MASASIRNPQTFNRYSYVLNSPYKFVDPLGLLSVTSGSACGQWCSNGDVAAGVHVDKGYQDITKNFLEQQAEEPEPPPPPSADQNAAQPSVSSEVTAQARVAVVAYGQPGTGENDVGTNFRRAAAQTQANLEANGWTVIPVGEISSLYGFQGVLDTAAKVGASSIYVFSHGASGAIDLGDGARNDTKDVTLSNVDSLRNNGTAATLFIRACFTGSSNAGIAAALSRRLGISVEAPTTGMSFSPYDDRLSTNTVHPSTGPTYMHAEGKGRLVVCTSGVCK